MHHRTNDLLVASLVEAAHGKRCVYVSRTPRETFRRAIACLPSELEGLATAEPADLRIRFADGWLQVKSPTMFSNGGTITYH